MWLPWSEFGQVIIVNLVTKLKKRVKDKFLFEIKILTAILEIILESSKKILN